MRDMENNYLQIRQKPGTDKILAKYLSACPIKEDTVYAYIYTPANCPRCEAPFKLVRQWLKEKGKKFMLISVFKDSIASKYYNEKKGYDADYHLYDTHDDYKKIFSFNNIMLDGSNILKITRSGRLITGGDPPLNGRRFIKQLIERRTPMSYHLFKDKDSGQEEVAVKVRRPPMKMMQRPYTDYIVESNVPLCKNTRNLMFIDDKFFYADELINGGLLFKLSAPDKKELKLISILKVDSLQKRTFVSITDKLYDQYLTEGMVFDIVLSPNMLDNSHIGLSYSLPKIVYENNDTTKVAFYNQACLLKCPIDKKGSLSIIPLDANLYKDKFFYKQFQYSSTGDKIILACQKLTWPLEYERADYADDVERNSFDRRFYKTDNPILAYADVKTGKIIHRFGHLDQSAEKGLTGYYFVNPISMVCGSELVYTDGYSGKVYLADTTDLEKEKACFTAFTLDDDLMPPIDSTKFYTYEYVKPYWALYDRCITDVRATDNAVYCIVTYGNNETGNSDDKLHTMIVIDRKTGHATEEQFPTYAGYESWGYGLRVSTGNKVTPFEVLKKGSNAIVREYSAPL